MNALEILHAAAAAKTIEMARDYLRYQWLRGLNKIEAVRLHQEFHGPYFDAEIDRQIAAHSYLSAESGFFGVQINTASCSQCGNGFGPGKNGFSDCRSHAGKQVTV